jgi:UDP-N-acetylglucosamine diphosphorylase/glucosamine-1-phosphate N-acetyltransferase
LFFVISFGYSPVKMMQYVLFDDETRLDLLPFTFLRPVALIRVGVLTLHGKWERWLEAPCSLLAAPHLRKKYPFQPSGTPCFINGSLLPDRPLVEAIRALAPGTKLVKDGLVLAAVTGTLPGEPLQAITGPDLKEVNYPGPVSRIRQNWDIFVLNAAAILSDVALLTAGRQSAPLPPWVRTSGSGPIFVEEGAVLRDCMINTSEGPVYIARGAEIMEGAMIRGPFALCESSVVKMGAKIYPGTTVGPYSRVGGELNNSVIFGFSNKAHDGFLGNSVIGEWCNLGADTNNSNLKNNYSTARMWNYRQEAYVDTGLQFCGLMMGDHSKCSINTMFNTGTVVGLCSNIFGNGFPPKYIPSFSWGGSDGFSNYRLQDAIDMAQRVAERRKMEFGEADRELFRQLFDESTRHRAWQTS